MNDDLRKKKSDYLLELALEEQLEIDEEMNAYGTGSITPYEFSDEHISKIEEILRIAENKEKRFKRRRKQLQVAVCLVLALSVSAFTVNQVEAFRLPFMRFFSEIKDKSTKFGIQGENNFNLTKNYQQFEPQYIPDGFCVDQVEEGNGTFSIKYMNEQKKQIYTIWFFNENLTREIDTEEAGIVETEINGNETYIIEKKNEVRVWMNIKEQQYFLRGEISIDDAKKVMGSIK